MREGNLFLDLFHSFWFYRNHLQRLLGRQEASFFCICEGQAVESGDVERRTLLKLQIPEIEF